MNELVNNLDITVRLAILIELGHDMDRDTQSYARTRLRKSSD